jgi:hypothetical protein
LRESIALSVGALISSLLLSGIAVAQEPYSVSGPAAGSNVKPSTAIQKEDEGRSASVDAWKQASYPGVHPTGAGVPGVEGKPGTQSGK